MKVWISGYYGKGNIGDEVILTSLIENLRQDLVPTVFSNDPSATKAMHHVSSMLPPPINHSSGKAGVWYGRGYWAKFGLKLLLEGFRVSAHLYAGGGMLNDHDPGRVIKYKNFIKALRRIGHNCPVALLGIGVDRINRQRDRKAFKEMFDNDVAYCSVRDMESYKAVCDLGIDSAHVNLTSDLAFAANVSKLELIENQDKIFDGGVGVNLRPLFEDSYNYGTSEKSRTRYFEKCVELIHKLLKSYPKVFLVPFGPDDKIFLSKIAERTGADMLGCNVHPYEMMHTLSKFKVFVGMRYHSILFCLLAKTPCVPLAYSPKVVHIAKEIGSYLDSLTVGDGEEMPDRIFDVDAVCGELLNAFNNRQTIVEKYTTICREKKQNVQEDLSRCWNKLLGDY